MSVSVSICSFAIPGAVYASDNIPQYTSMNLDFGQKLKSSAVDSGNNIFAMDPLCADYSYNSSTYTSDEVKIEKNFRNALVDHKSSFSFKYATTDTSLTSSQKNFVYLCSDFLMGATSDQLSQSNKDGDYIRWQLGGMSLGAKYEGKKSNTAFYTITYSKIVYYSTLSQESKVDSFVKSFFDSFDQNKLSDFELIKKIHNKVCSQTVYDNDFEKRAENDYTDYTAYGCLYARRCVCQGYSLAFYRLCKEAGLSARFVSSDPTVGCHAWNIVNLGGKYYYVDCTWDDTFYDNDANQKGQISYAFLLKNQYDIKDYDGTSCAHDLFQKYYSDNYFINKYKNNISEESYDSSSPNLGNVVFDLSSSTFAYDGGKKYPTIKGTYQNSAVTDFTASGATNAVNIGTYTITLNGTGNYAGTNIKRTFKIIPAKIGSIKVSSRGSDYLTLTWGKQTGASGYVIEQMKDGKWKALKTINSYSTTSYKVTSLNPNGQYKFRIRGFYTTKYGSYSNTFTSCTNPKKVGSVKASPSKKAFTVKWGKVSSNGYQIQYSTSSNFSSAKTIYVSSGSTSSKKISSLKSKKKYYVRVRAVKNRVSGKNTYKYYGSWSSKAAVTTK